MTFGRAIKNNMVFVDAEVSSSHGCIAWDDRCNSWRVQDVGSLNGTKLNALVISDESRAEGGKFTLVSAVEPGGTRARPTDALSRAPPGRPPPPHLRSGTGTISRRG